MADGFGVSPDHLRTLGVLLAQAAGDLQASELTPVRAAYDQLLPTWTGADQVRFRALVEPALVTAETLVTRLAAIGSLLVSTAGHYETVDAGQGDRLSAIGAVLRG